MSCLKSCLLAAGCVSDDPCLKVVNNYLVLCLGSIILAFLSILFGLKKLSSVFLTLLNALFNESYLRDILNTF